MSVHRLGVIRRNEPCAIPGCCSARLAPEEDIFGFLESTEDQLQDGNEADDFNRERKESDLSSCSNALSTDQSSEESEQESVSNPSSPSVVIERNHVPTNCKILCCKKNFTVIKIAKFNFLTPFKKKNSSDIAVQVKLTFVYL